MHHAYQNFKYYEPRYLKTLLCLYFQGREPLLWVRTCTNIGAGVLQQRRIRVHAQPRSICPDEILLIPPNISILIGFLWSLCHFVATFTGFLKHFELFKSDKYWYNWWYQKYFVFYLLIRCLAIRCRPGILKLLCVIWYFLVLRK